MLVENINNLDNKEDEEKIVLQESIKKYKEFPQYVP